MCSFIPWMFPPAPSSPSQSLQPLWHPLPCQASVSSPTPGSRCPIFNGLISHWMTQATSALVCVQASQKEAPECLFSTAAGNVQVLASPSGSTTQFLVERDFGDPQPLLPVEQHCHRHYSRFPMALPRQALKTSRDGAVPTRPSQCCSIPVMDLPNLLSLCPLLLVFPSAITMTHLPHHPSICPAKSWRLLLGPALTLSSQGKISCNGELPNLSRLPNVCCCSLFSGVISDSGGSP